MEVRISAGGKFIIFTIHNCWHVPSLPHHSLSNLLVTSPSRGHHVMLVCCTPRLLFPQKHCLTEPNLLKYVPFTRERGYFVLKFDLPTQVSIPPQYNLTVPTSAHSITPILSLQASLHHPFVGLSFNQSSFSSPFPLPPPLPPPSHITITTHNKNFNFNPSTPVEKN